MKIRPLQDRIVDGQRMVEVGPRRLLHQAAHHPLDHGTISRDGKNVLFREGGDAAVVLDLAQPKRTRVLAPHGKHVLSLNVGNAPYRLREGTWPQQRDVFAVAFAWGWLATNLFEVATYAGDAVAMSLPLVTPGGGHAIHDWNYVLGAWGCGVFANDPADVARWFARFLTGTGPYGTAFRKVVFAVLDGSADEATLRHFEQLFGDQGATQA